MSQPTGYPGGGVRLSKGCLILSGIGAPSASVTPDVQNSGIGSLYLQTDVAALFICTAAASFENGVLLNAATWQQVTIP
jgi:hypothetical protein